MVSFWLFAVELFVVELVVVVVLLVVEEVLAGGSF